ncbi:MAG: hypothetical protein KGZ75_08795 [Syntrophomonadaceae bacterium]|nr:hypothetical protein [Syntrophomonadaceae bacterium]
MLYRLKFSLTCLLVIAVLVLFASSLPASANSIPRWPQPEWFAQFNTTPAPSPSPVPAPTQPPAAGTGIVLTAQEARMVEMVNQERANRGLPPFKVNLTLTKLARMKSQDLLDNNYFAHYSPTYGSAYDMMRREGIRFRYAAENLARHSSLSGAHYSLMASSGHRSKILGKNYSEIGIGIVRTPRGGVIVTQMFVGY